MQAGMNFDAEGTQAAAAFVLCSSAVLSLAQQVSHLSSCGFSLANDDAFSRGRPDLKVRRDYSR